MVPAEEHIHFSKMDFADDYRRMIVEPEVQWNFAYVMPSASEGEVQSVIPRALQMGWNESPAYSCATTEKVGDVAQTWIDNKTRRTKHPMGISTRPTRPVRQQNSNSPPHQMLVVYMGDFLFAAVQDAPGTLLQRTARATLHAIHSMCSQQRQQRGHLMPKTQYPKRSWQKGTHAGRPSERSSRTGCV
jgi:hypothetical protein